MDYEKVILTISHIHSDIRLKGLGPSSGLGDEKNPKKGKNRSVQSTTQFSFSLQ